MKWRISVAVLMLALPAAGCRVDQRMAQQPAYRPLEASEFFGDARSARAAVPGTVARGHLRDDDAYFTGKAGADFVDPLPRPVTREMLERGRERYDIFCAPCHDRMGTGLGMVVRRGYPQPPSMHIERLRQARAGYLFDVITRGFGRMPEYAPQIPVEDRWAIVAYLKALNLSQNAAVGDVPESERPALEGAPGEKR